MFTSVLAAVVHRSACFLELGFDRNGKKKNLNQQPDFSHSE
jgi:hypothetical protein